MTYFTQENFTALLSAQSGNLGSEAGLQSTYNRLIELHQALYPRLRKHGFNLHTDALPQSRVLAESVSTLMSEETLTISYTRSLNQAQAVESIMGREDEIEPRRHPIIELRVTPYGFTIELIISPEAWCDQQNFVGKISIDQHRAAFSKLLAKLNGDYCFGFWGGTELSDMHLNTGKMPPARIVTDWLNTFAAGRDYLRVGHWYEPSDPALNAENIVSEVFNRVRDLYTLYDFIAWTSNNNFHHFYSKAVAARA
jgi:hypothetical protein